MINNMEVKVLFESEEKDNESEEEEVPIEVALGKPKRTI